MNCPVSYPITRTFTSICMGVILCILPASLPAASAADIAKLSFKGPAGQSLTLGGFAGKPLVVNLWATWCAPCVAEMPELAALQKTYKDQGLVVLTLSEDDMPETGAKFFLGHSITGLTGYFDQDHAVMKKLSARGLPTTYLIGKNGAIFETIEGPITSNPEAFKNDIAQLLTSN